MGNTIEKTGKFYYGDRSNLINLNDESLLLENQIKVKQDKVLQKELANKLIEIEKAKQDEILAKLETMELMPSSNKIIVLAYPKNPYRRRITDSGIITDYDGTFKNPDTGESDTLKEGITVGKVIEVGPECKWIKPGDDVYYDSRQAFPLPFMSLGYKLTTEGGIFAVVNEGLKERWGM